ncbi:Phosphatidate phosphatase APP1-like protein [Microdochium nivale]|nr:Phosphatidate phosphatase APP1-like protein [Microdochium nivale]
MRLTDITAPPPKQGTSRPRCESSALVASSATQKAAQPFYPLCLPSRLPARRHDANNPAIQPPSPRPLCLDHLRRPAPRVCETTTPGQLVAYSSSRLLLAVFKLAPPRRLFTPRPHPHNKSSLLQYIFPKPIRDRYRARLFNFHFHTLPGVKHGLQSRIYRFILERQRRRKDQSRLVDQARRLLTGRQRTNSAAGAVAPRSLIGARVAQSASGRKTGKKMTSLSGYGVGSGHQEDSEAGAIGREPGSRRRKLAAMAGSVYRAGASAASEIRESYNQTRSREIDHPETSKFTIPGSFPDVAIITKGNEQMVLFPSYAKRHVRNEERQFEVPAGAPPASAVNVNEQEYWRQEWSKYEDERAVVDVDIRGWIYHPHRGPITRRNRMLIGLARQLSGIPLPSVQQSSNAGGANVATLLQEHEEMRDQERIAMRAKEIERQGEEEQREAQKGGYSERPSDPSIEDGEEGSRERLRHSSGSTPIGSRSGSPIRASARRTNTATSIGAELNEAELAVANANLMARIAPFMTNPLVEVPITLFFYNDTDSQSRTVTTNDTGHFMTRVALDFVPTHVRVMASESISCVEPVQIIEPKGVSLISDIDDTIKRSNISLGAKEIFRNTFIRDLDGAAVEGVREWYTSMHDLGVKIHYCSNSPWQLFPVLATFFKLAGLPPGSLHLKAYSGMLQGIFEPVAERKKGTLERIMKDFPERRFILVGDSGEADLEVYTELALANPKRILGIFIRDVTTPEKRGYFDSGFNADSGGPSRSGSLNRAENGKEADDPSSRPSLPARTTQQNKPQETEQDLIDFSEDSPAAAGASSSSTEAKDMAGTKKAPPRPVKPKALQSSQSLKDANGATGTSKLSGQAPEPPMPRRLTTQQGQQARPLTSRQNSFGAPSSSPASRANGSAPDPPPPRRRGTPSNHEGSSTAPQQGDESRRGSASTGSTHADSKVGVPAYQLAHEQQLPQSTDRKVDLWQARMQRAHETLDDLGVPLYTWRRGVDVIDVTESLIKRSLKELGVEPAKSRKG